MKTYLVTGAAGFIGANFVKYLLKTKNDIRILALDLLTYAGNLKNIEQEIKLPNVEFFKGDICDGNFVKEIFTKNDVDVVVHFAAESHVDRSINQPDLFLKTNILGTQNLLEQAKAAWMVGSDEKGYPIYQWGKRFHHVSTDEVYGSLEFNYPQGKSVSLKKEVKKIAQGRKKITCYGKDFFYEENSLVPRSPYSASKAASDMIVMAYGETYHMPFSITRCSNNYGPYHFPEKLIPLMIKNTLEGKSLPVYGEGLQVRDWLYVEDHCKAISMVIDNSPIGEVYNVGGFNESKNIDIVKLIISTIKNLMTENPNYQAALKTDLNNIDTNLITYVEDRLGHDMRYAIDPTKIVKQLGWYPETTFAEGIKKTVKWYLENQDWVNEVTSGEYQNYYKKMYEKG